MTDAPSSFLVARVVEENFPGADLRSVERVNDGVSTWVYRFRRGGNTYYLRILPEEGPSFGPEALAHSLMLDLGVRVPEVVHFNHFDDVVQRSVMVTSEIRGRHIGHLTDQGLIRDVLVEAGTHLALMNSIPVDGFGWVKRDLIRCQLLEAEFPTHREFIMDSMGSHLRLISERLLGAEIAIVEHVITHYDAWLDCKFSVLVHGDFDATHIFQHDGHFSGIIDFGEIRGASSFYDLGHFRLHDEETLSKPVLRYLIDGYRQVLPLPSDYEMRISFFSLLIGVRRLARMLERFPGRDFSNHHVVAAIHRELDLLG